MLQRQVDGARLLYRAADRTLAEVCADCYVEVKPAVEELWDLQVQRPIRLGVGPRWVPFMFAHQPWWTWPFVAADAAGQYVALYGTWADGAVLVHCQRALGIFLNTRSFGVACEEQCRKVLCRQLSRVVLLEAGLPRWLQECLAVVGTNELYDARLRPPLSISEVPVEQAAPWRPYGTNRDVRLTQSHWVSWYLYHYHPELVHAISRPEAAGRAMALISEHFNAPPSRVFSEVLCRAREASVHGDSK